MKAIVAQGQQNSAGAVGASAWMAEMTFSIQWPELTKHKALRSTVLSLASHWHSARQSHACPVHTPLSVQQMLPLNVPQHSIQLSQTVSVQCPSKGFEPDSVSGLEDKQQLVMLGEERQSF